MSESHGTHHVVVEPVRTDLAPGVAVKADALATSAAHMRVARVVFMFVLQVPPRSI